MTRLMPALAAVFALTGYVATADARPRAMTAEHFAQTAAISNQFEIQSSQLALQKSPSADVKQFAEKMISDHTELGQEMQDAVKQANMPAPSEQLDAKHKQILTKLQGLEGSGFDRQYITDQVNAHLQAVNLLQQYSTNGQSQPLKQWAATGLPTIQQHLQMVRTLEKDHNVTASR